MLGNEFINYLNDHGYPPEPWCSEDQMDAHDWVFDSFEVCEGELYDPDEYVPQEDLDPEDEDYSDPTYEEKLRSPDGRPQWWKDLKLVKKGAPSDNSIDNCVGEFHNFHSALGKFFGERHQCNIELTDEPWFDQSDQTYSKTQKIRYRVNEKNEVSVSRYQSSVARKEKETFDAFIDQLNTQFERACRA